MNKEVKQKDFDYVCRQKNLKENDVVLGLIESEKLIGQLYPVLVDEQGNVLDGQHRLKADPNWRKEVIKGLDSERKKAMIRLHANWHRRREHPDQVLRELAKITQWKGSTEYAAFLGPENVSHVTLQQLCEGKFELAELYGKLANICDDLPGDALKSVGNFKNLTGNSPILAQYKHKNPFSFLNTAKLFFSCNNLPKASEDSIAYYRRFNIFPFNRFFLGEKADTRKIEKLTTPTELSGLLNYALDGLERLLKRGQFSSSLSIEETRQQYIRTADSCQSFIEESTEIDNDPNKMIPDDEFYSAYVNYCNKNKLPIQKKAQLTQAMQSARPEAEHINQRVLGKVTRVWRYVKFVADVATVAGILSLEKIQNQNSIIKKVIATPATTAITVPNETVERTCGQCACWHKTSCSYPDAEPSCVSPLNKYAQNCKDFGEKRAEEVQHEQ